MNVPETNDVDDQAADGRSQIRPGSEERRQLFEKPGDIAEHADRRPTAPGGSLGDVFEERQEGLFDVEDFRSRHRKGSKPRETATLFLGQYGEGLRGDGDGCSRGGVVGVRRRPERRSDFP